MNLFDHSAEYVMTSVMDANTDLAREYAAYMVRLEEDGGLTPLTSHATEFPAWAVVNTRECAQCAARYAHRIAGSATFICGACGCGVTR